MWSEFADLGGPLQPHAVALGHESPDEAADLLAGHLRAGNLTI